MTLCPLDLLTFATTSTLQLYTAHNRAEIQLKHLNEVFAVSKRTMHVSFIGQYPGSPFDKS